MQKTSPTIFSSVESLLPPLVWRHRWNEYRDKCGLPFSRGTMQNMDSEGRGPGKVMFGKRVAYKREDLIQWLNSMAGGQHGKN